MAAVEILIWNDEDHDRNEEKDADYPYDAPQYIARHPALHDRCTCTQSEERERLIRTAPFSSFLFAHYSIA